MEMLAKCWIESRKYDVESNEYEELSWAVDKLNEMVYSDTEKLLQVVKIILETDDSEAVVGAIGAGVLEEAIVEKGDSFIDEISQLAKSNESFRRCAKYIFISESDVSNSVFAKFIKLKNRLVDSSF